MCAMRQLIGRKHGTPAVAVLPRAYGRWDEVNMIETLENSRQTGQGYRFVIVSTRRGEMPR